jgi:hypothetical protein
MNIGNLSQGSSRGLFEEYYFIISMIVGSFLGFIIYLNQREAKLNREYREKKLQAKLQAQNLFTDFDLKKVRSVSQNDDAFSISSDKGNLLKNDSGSQKGDYSNKTVRVTKRMKDGLLDQSQILKQSKHPVTRICLTGGPCAGKTTALATLS